LCYLFSAYQDVAAKSMQTEQGRKLGEAVAQTSRAVGKYLNTCKSSQIPGGLPYIEGRGCSSYLLGVKINDFGIF